MRRRRTVYLQKIALLFISILIAFAIGETVCRLRYTKPWYAKLLEEQHQSRWRKNLRINSLGLRDYDYSTPKPPNTTRVLILGDSFTYGQGVPENEAVFPERLEKELGSTFSKQGKQIEILNGGIPGSLTDEWLTLLSRVKDPFDPDVILIVFFLRDGTRTSSMGGFFSPIRDEIKARNEDSFLYQYVYLFRIFQEYRDRMHLSRQYSKKLYDSYFGNEDQTQEWKIAQKNLLAIKEIGKELNAKVALIVFPILVELNAYYPFKEISETIIQFGDNNGFPTHDLLPAFMGNYGPDLWVSSFDQHPNAKAHEITSTSILPFLEELL